MRVLFEAAEVLRVEAGAAKYIPCCKHQQRELRFLFLGVFKQQKLVAGSGHPSLGNVRTLCMAAAVSGDCASDTGPGITSVDD